MPEALAQRKRESLASMQDRGEVLLELIEDPSLPEEERSECRQELEQLLRVELPRKVDNVTGYLQYCQDMQKVGKQRLEWIAGKIAMWAKREEDLRKLVKVIMQVSGVKSYKGALSTITLKPPSGSVDVYSTAQLPLEYFLPLKPPKLEPDKFKIRRAINAGIEVPGARMIPGDDVLEVR